MLISWRRFGFEMGAWIVYNSTFARQCKMWKWWTVFDVQELFPLVLMSIKVQPDQIWRPLYHAHYIPKGV